MLDTGIATHVDSDAGSKYGSGPCMRIPALERAHEVWPLPFFTEFLNSITSEENCFCQLATEWLMTLPESERKELLRVH